MPLSYTQLKDTETHKYVPMLRVWHLQFYHRQLDALGFYALFNSISVISGRCVVDNERLCAITFLSDLQSLDVYSQLSIARTLLSQKHLIYPGLRLNIFPVYIPTPVMPNYCYLKLNFLGSENSKLLISQSKFSDPRKFTLWYQWFGTSILGYWELTV